MTESHDDPWESARASQREDVQAIFAKRAAAPVEDRRRERLFTPRRFAVLAGLLLACGVIAALTAPGQRRVAGAERRAARAEQARLEAAERARLRKDVRPRFATGPARRPGEDALAYRARLVGAAETAITADARARMRAGTFKGPVAGTDCHVYPTTPTRRGLERDPAQTSGRYTCIAYERKIALYHVEGRSDVGLVGAPYWLVAQYGSARLAFCKITPRPSEGGQSLVDVEVPAACKAADA